MATPPEIVAAMRASRADFADIFLRAQCDLPLEERAELEVVAATASAKSDAEAYLLALQYAQVKGFLDEVEHALIAASLEDGTLLRARAAAAAADARDVAEQQAITSFAAGLAEGDVDVRGMTRAMRWTVRVDIDGKPRGTGILVGPHLVLTAWHVVKELFKPVLTGWEPDAGCAARLKVTFDDILRRVAGGALRQGKTMVFDAAEAWCPGFSAAHAAELDDRIPSNLAELEGHWDYALLVLSAAPGAERSWMPLDTRAIVPQPDADIVLFQHAGGQSMRYGRGKIRAAAERELANRRFLHAASAAGGSSGGPCFDKSFALFGLHQGTWTEQDEKLNRGIPIVPIIRHLRDTIGELPKADSIFQAIREVTVNGVALPVLGAEDFQIEVWRSVTGGKNRILSLTGDVGVGKTFRLSILQEMLPTVGHLKVVLDAPTCSKDDARALVARIARAVGADLASVAQAPDNESRATWVNQTLRQSLLDALEQARGGRLVWICLADLDRTDIQGQDASELLNALYESVATVPWLRFMLDGMRGDVPSRARPFAQKLRTERPGRHDVEEATGAYLRRAIVTRERELEDTAVRALCRSVGRRYERALDEDAAEAMAIAQEQALESLADYLEAQQ